MGDERRAYGRRARAGHSVELGELAEVDVGGE
jgi:hypothetical protein